MKRVLSVLFVAAALVVGVLAGPAPAAAAEKSAHSDVDVLVLPAGQKLVQISGPSVITRPMTSADRPEVYTIDASIRFDGVGSFKMHSVIVERGAERGASASTDDGRKEVIVLPAGRKLVSFTRPFFVTRPMKPGERPMTYSAGIPLCDENLCSLRPLGTIREQKK